VYATVSCLVVIFAVIQYVDAEFSEQAQERWQRRSNWKRIQPGMTKTEAVAILGPAFYHYIWYEMDRNDYKLHALDIDDSAIVYYSIVPENGTEVGKVVEKNPTDDELAEADSRWLPYYESRNYSTLKDRFIQTAMAFSFIGVFLLAILSLLPIWSTDWNSLAFYLPAAAVVLYCAYENGLKGGWRCDVIFLLPMYAIIIGMWLYRMILVINK